MTALMLGLFIVYLIVLSLRIKNDRENKNNNNRY
jgi:preprotein translocase subunit SecG